MEVELSDGECVTLRPVREGDARPLLAFFGGLSEESDRFYCPFAAPD